MVEETRDLWIGKEKIKGEYCPQYFKGHYSKREWILWGEVVLLQKKFPLRAVPRSQWL